MTQLWPRTLHALDRRARRHRHRVHRRLHRRLRVSRPHAASAHSERQPRVRHFPTTAAAAGIHGLWPAVWDTVPVRVDAGV